MRENGQKVPNWTKNMSMTILDIQELMNALVLANIWYANFTNGSISGKVSYSENSECWILGEFRDVQDWHRGFGGG